MKVEGKNVVLVVADTLTALHLPTYGYDRETAPFLTELAEKNMFFENAYSNAPWTVPSHASLFSGKLPSEHGMGTSEMIFEDQTFVEELSKNAYKTTGISANSLVSEDLNFDRGFDSFHEVFSFDTEDTTTFWKVAFRKLKSPDLETIKKGSKFLYNKLTGTSNRGAENIEKIAKKEVTSENQPNFLFINYTEPHLPYNPPEEYAEKFTENSSEKISRHMEDHYNSEKPEIFHKGFPNCTDQELIDLYDAEIRYLDNKLESLYKYLNEELDNLVFIVTSDHGENFGEHGAYFHQCGIWEKSVRVPMIIAGNEVPDKKKEKPYPLRNLKHLILDNEVNTSETVFAEYQGWNKMSELNQETELKVENKEKRFAYNQSKAAIQKDKALVKNTQLKDFQFTPDQKCYSQQKQCFEKQEDLETKIDLIIGQ